MINGLLLNVWYYASDIYLAYTFVYIYWKAAIGGLDFGSTYNVYIHIGLDLLFMGSIGVCYLHLPVLWHTHVSSLVKYAQNMHL